MEKMIKPGKLEKRDKWCNISLTLWVIFFIIELIAKEGTTVDKIFGIASTLAILLFMYNLIGCIFMIVDYHIKLERHEATEYLAEQEIKTQGTTTEDLKP